MDRTFRMMRRTFKCAAFACPLALWGYFPALLAWSICTLSLFFMLPSRTLWRQKAAFPRQRIVFSFLGGLTACLLPQALLSLCFSGIHSATAAFIRLLAVSGGLCMQCLLLEQMRFIRKKHWGILGILLLISVYMQSIA